MDFCQIREGANFVEVVGVVTDAPDESDERPTPEGDGDQVAALDGEVVRNFKIEDVDSKRSAHEGDDGGKRPFRTGGHRLGELDQAGQVADAEGGFVTKLS